MQLSEIPRWFLKTSAGQAIAREHEVAEHAERDVLFAEMTEAQRAAEEATAKHEAIIAPLQAIAAKSKAKADADALRVVEAQRVATREIYAHRARRDRAERGLVATADPRIDEARLALERRFQADHHGMAQSQELPPIGRNPETGNLIRRVVTNDKAIARLHVALRSARAELVALKAANPPDVAAAIRAITVRVDSAWGGLGFLE